MNVKLIKTKEQKPSSVPEGREYKGTISTVRYYDTDEKRIGPFESDYYRKEITPVTSLVQIEEGDIVLITEGDLMHTSPIVEILEISEVDITFRTRTSEYIARLI